jgi:uncharacterized protein
MMLGIVVGTVGGVSLLARVDPKWSGLALGIALVLYAAYALISPVLSVSSRLDRWLSPIVGLVSALAVGLSAHGEFKVDQLGLSTIALVPALAGMWLGQQIPYARAGAIGVKHIPK